MPDLTVAAGLARGLIDFAAAKGANRAELARRAAIDPALLEDQDNRIPFANYVALMRIAKELTGDPALALHYGETRDLSKFSIVGLLGNAAESMMEAFAQLNRYGRLVIEFDGPKDRFRLARDAHGLWIVDTREHPNDFPELTESTFASLICGPRTFGVTQIAKRIEVTHTAPAWRSEYDRVFGAPTVFDAARNAMLIDESWLNHKMAQEQRYVFGILSEHADALLKTLESSKTLRGRVESLLMPILHTGDASMDAIAARLAMSRPTLARRLKVEGTTFEKILDELRHQMALGYLQAKRVSVNETAYLVGFSDPASFSRAFKRWTGTSPRAMRTASPQHLRGPS